MAETHGRIQGGPVQFGVGVFSKWSITRIGTGLFFTTSVSPERRAHSIRPGSRKGQQVEPILQQTLEHQSGLIVRGNASSLCLDLIKAARAGLDLLKLKGADVVRIANHHLHVCCPRDPVTRVFRFSRNAFYSRGILGL